MQTNLFFEKKLLLFQFSDFIIMKESFTLDRSFMRKMSFVFPLCWIRFLSSATSTSSSKMWGFGPSGILPVGVWEGWGGDGYLADQPSLQRVSSNHRLCYEALLHLPVIHEEAVLDENVNDEIHKSLGSHAKQVPSDEDPAKGIRTIVLTCKNSKALVTTAPIGGYGLAFMFFQPPKPSARSLLVLFF